MGDGSYGIRFSYDCLYNEVYNNIIKNKDTGIYLLYDSNKNYIYHNDFINSPAETNYCMRSYWHDGYPSGGNYWSHYTGVDLYSGQGQNIPGSDGIGDTPMSFRSDQDKYPLMNPYNTINEVPVANAGPDHTVWVGEVVQFDGSGSYDPDGTIVSYEWDFGDGTSVTLTNPFTSHTYVAIGTYTVILTVTDNDGATAADTCLVTVIQNPSTATATGPQGSNHDPIIVITYDWTGSPSAVCLYYSTNVGDTWNYLGTDYSVDGNYDWIPGSNPEPKPSKYYWIANAKNGADDVGIPADGTSPEAGPFNWKTWDTCESAPLPLAPGSPNWFFISVPLDFSGDVVTVFDDANWGDGGTTWDVIQWYDPTDISNPWKSYSIYRPPSLNDNTVIDNTKGFWIHLTGNEGDGVLTAGSGTEPVPTSIQLYAGWNLVGYPAVTEVTVSDAFWGTGVDLRSFCPIFDK
jgi:PKD repeat protein